MIDLKEFDFRSHPAGFQAVAHFENGWGVSILPEANMVSYEVAILRHDNGNFSHVSYESGITEDVLRYLTRDQVHDVVSQARNLKGDDHEQN
jgi:hypothetical protein